MAGARLGPPPREVEDALLLARWGGSLATGGLLDQPYKRLRTMTKVMDVFNPVRHYTDWTGGDTEYSNKFPGNWEVVTAAMPLLMEHAQRNDGESI